MWQALLFRVQSYPSSCSNNYINGTFIHPTLDKYLRLCELCNQRMEAAIRELHIRLGEVEEKSESEDSSYSSCESNELEILHIF